LEVLRLGTAIFGLVLLEVANDPVGLSRPEEHSRRLRSSGRVGTIGPVSVNEFPARRMAFLEALEAIAALVGREETAAAWSSPSVLEGYDVGSLAGHVTSTVEALERYLAAPDGTGDLVDATDYYSAVPTPELAADLHAGVRERGAAIGELGPARVRERLVEAHVRLDQRLSVEDGRRVLAVFGGVPMRLDEYLVTRIVELVVHGDDLAVSVGVGGLETSATPMAVDALVAVARRRHGETAVLRGLARQERDEVNALRAL
jgi:uncharacterized protein (TIGR03083 family)